MTSVHVSCFNVQEHLQFLPSDSFRLNKSCIVAPLPRIVMPAQQECVDPFHVRLHPSGFFSALHGSVTPFLYAIQTGRTMISPEIAEFTGRSCARDISCFFLPLSARECSSNVYISPRKQIDVDFNMYGSKFNTVSQIIHYVFRLNDKMKNFVYNKHKEYVDRLRPAELL